MLYMVTKTTLTRAGHELYNIIIVTSSGKRKYLRAKLKLSHGERTVNDRKVNAKM